MTSIVGIRCSDGVTIASDSAATLGPDPSVRIAETSVKKVFAIGGGVILAGTGAIGHDQRVRDIIQDQWTKKSFSNRKGLDIGRMLAREVTKDFGDTRARMGNYGALVAFQATDGPTLCEFGLHDFQPEVKELD